MLHGLSFLPAPRNDGGDVHQIAVFLNLNIKVALIEFAAVVFRHWPGTTLRLAQGDNGFCFRP
jgi:hypothetical protein